MFKTRKEVEELEERILQLEKRLEDYRRKNNNEISDIKAQMDIYKEYTTNRINELESKLKKRTKNV